MKLAPQYEFNDEQDKALRKARRLEYISLAYLVSVILLMYTVMGSSQAMKTAWVEDCLSLIPPVMFLLCARFCHCAPTEDYPYGRQRLISIGFLAASLALLFVGLILAGDAIHTLAVRKQDRKST